MARKRKRKLWSFNAGARGSTVTVYEREPDGTLYARAWDRNAANGHGGWRVSLKHRDKDVAERFALKEAARLKDSVSEIVTGTARLSRLFALYQQHRTPRKVKTEQQVDARRAELWARWLGADKDPQKITLHEWESFCDARSSGAIDARGTSAPTGKRKSVRDRSVEGDLVWLKLVLNWGSKWRDREGRYLLRENAVRGYGMPSERNVQRPVATHERYQAIRRVSDDIMMEVRWDGHRNKQRSYLSEVLGIVNGTGRRISSVCALRYDDLSLSSKPFGAIRWRADSDKTGKESIVPISQEVRITIDRVLAERPGVGATYIFPSPTDPARPISRYLVSEWLRRAERVANIPKQRGGLWHPYRRKWATERKHFPDVDVAAAGGWAELTSLKRAYQQADDATMLRVVLEPGRLREKHA